MSRRNLKLGAVLLGVGGPSQHHTWLDPEIPGDASVDIRWYIARAQQAEAARFDHVFIVDSQFITPDSPHHYLNRLDTTTATGSNLSPCCPRSPCTPTTSDWSAP